MRARSDRDPVAGDMHRLRRRGKLTTGIGSAGYIATFIVDIVRNTPHDDSIVNGVERAFGFIAIAGFLTALAVWTLAEYNRASERRQADDLDWTLGLGLDIADSFPRQGRIRTPNVDNR